MLYVVVHTRISTPTRLVSHNAARRNLVGDLFVTPPRPIEVGMQVQLVEIRATNEAVLDGSKNRLWRIIPGLEVRGRVVGFRAHERSSVEFIVANDWEFMWDAGISSAFITVKYDAGVTARLGVADRIVRACLRVSRILPSTRKLAIIPLEAFNRLAVTDDSPPQTPISAPATAPTLVFPHPPVTAPPPLVLKSSPSKPSRLDTPSPIPPLPESISLSKSYARTTRPAWPSRGSYELSTVRERPSPDDEDDRSSVGSAAVASTEEDTFRFRA